jgi:hypothetical protein
MAHRQDLVEECLEFSKPFAHIETKAGMNDSCDDAQIEPFDKVATRILSKDKRDVRLCGSGRTPAS